VPWLDAGGFSTTLPVWPPRRKGAVSTIPQLQLVYYRTSTAPITRHALSKPLSVSLRTSSLVICAAGFHFAHDSYKDSKRTPPEKSLPHPPKRA
jgi:hypothetical protein